MTVDRQITNAGMLSAECRRHKWHFNDMLVLCGWRTNDSLHAIAWFDCEKSCYYTKLGRQIRRTNDRTNIKSGSDWLLMSISRGYSCCLCWRTKFFIFQSFCCFFTQKQVFGPHNAKTQPVWIKFCTLLLYGIHLHIFFRSTTKIDEVIAGKPFLNSGVTRRLWTLGSLELTLVVNTCF